MPTYIVLLSFSFYLSVFLCVRYFLLFCFVFISQVPLELSVQVVPHEPQEQVSDLPADVGLIFRQTTYDTLSVGQWQWCGVVCRKALFCCCCSSVRVRVFRIGDS